MKEGGCVRSGHGMRLCREGLALPQLLLPQLRPSGCAVPLPLPIWRSAQQKEAHRARQRAVQVRASSGQCVLPLR